MINTVALDAEIAELEEELQKKQNELAFFVATDAPLISNPKLIETAIPHVEELIDRKSKASESVLQTLFKVLPERLFDEAPQPREHLTEEQKKFYIKKLKSLLEAFDIEDEVAAGLIEELDLGRARQLIDLLRGINGSIKSAREDRSRRLREVSQLKIKLNDKQAERNEAKYGSSDVAAECRSIEVKYGKISSKSDELIKKLKAWMLKFKSLWKGKVKFSKRLESLSTRNMTQPRLING